jgi:hypothetical protein
MSYYQNLINHMEKYMRLHPNSAIVMDSDTFKVIATGKNMKAIARRMKKAAPLTGIPVLFQRTKAKGAYTYRHLNEDKDQSTRHAAILKFAPIELPQTAVRAAIASKARK